MNPSGGGAICDHLGLDIVSDINQGLNYKSKHEAAEIHQPVPYR
ncbi:MAG: hypothetical protein RIS79_820 [Verrucomicrobiota bacterium]